MQLTERIKKMRLIILLIPFLTVGGCSLASQPMPTYPVNLNVMKLDGGGICLDKESADKLAAFIADLEAL